MLNQDGRYFVRTDFGRLTRATLESWANRNMMKLGESAVLTSGELAYRLDTQYNENLRIAARTLSREGPDLMNDELRIGSVKCDRVLINHDAEACYVIRPEIPDR